MLQKIKVAHPKFTWLWLQVDQRPQNYFNLVPNLRDLHRFQEGCTMKIYLLQAPRPSPGPHKLRECLPLIVFLRNRLKYALNNDEVTKIMKQRLIKVDGKVRTDNTYPAGFMGKQY